MGNPSETQEEKRRASNGARFGSQVTTLGSPCFSQTTPALKAAEADSAASSPQRNLCLACNSVPVVEGATSRGGGLGFPVLYLDWPKTGLSEVCTCSPPFCSKLSSNQAGQDQGCCRKGLALDSWCIQPVPQQDLLNGQKKNRETEGCGSVDKKLAQHVRGPVYSSLHYINQLC